MNVTDMSKKQGRLMIYLLYLPLRLYDASYVLCCADREAFVTPLKLLSYRTQ